MATPVAPAATPDYPEDGSEVVPCLHCRVPLILNYDGLRTGWSHLYLDTDRPGRYTGLKPCVAEDLAAVAGARR